MERDRGAITPMPILPYAQKVLAFDLPNSGQNPHQMKPTQVPMPEPTTQPEEQPTPKIPTRRRTLILPVFTGRVRRLSAKAVITASLLIGGFAAQAQTQPVTDPPTSPGVPSKPMNPDAPQEPRRSTQQPTTPQTSVQDGWIMFDERNTMDLNLRDDQYQRLREVDGRYQKQYTGFGNTPSKNPGYKDLSDRRNTDVRGILSPEQYQQWDRLNNGSRENKSQGTDMDGSGTPTPPTPSKVPTPTTKTRTTP